MPYRLYMEDALLRIDLSGELRASAFLGFVAKVRSVEKRTSPTPSRLIDLSTVTAINVRYEAVALLAALRKAVRFPQAFKSAIVAPQPVHYGFARMFQTLNNHPQITIRIFAECGEALAWLKAG